MRVLPLALAAAGALVAREAAACSPPPCAPADFLPRSGTIPANAPALVWLPGRTFNDPATPEPSGKLFDGDTSVPYTRDIGANLVRPSALEPGRTYRFDATGGCQPLSTTFSTGPEAPLPKALGALVVEPTSLDDLRVATVSGSCSGTIVAAQAGVSVALADEAKPWAELLTYRTLVDEKPWGPAHGIGGGRFGESWEGRAKDRVFAFCKDGDFADSGVDKGLAEGVHRVRIEASVPGSAVTVSSATWEVDLRCDGQAAAPRLAETPLGGNPPVETVPEDGCASAGVGGAVLGLLARRRRCGG